jgi:hypothetical protein
VEYSNIELVSLRQTLVRVKVNANGAWHMHAGPDIHSLYSHLPQHKAAAWHGGNAAFKTEFVVL